MMMDSVTKRITELRTLNRLSMHDKQISRLPHIERTSTARVASYILKDKVVLVNTKQELCFSLATVHIKSIKAKRLLYSHNSEEVFPLKELVDKNYVQGFLVFINGYFMPWKYLNLVCLTEKNYLLVHVDSDDEIGMNFIRSNRAGSLKVDIVTIPDSYKYKELETPISETLGKDFVMGFTENLLYDVENVKYIFYCVDEDVEHRYNYDIENSDIGSINSDLNSEEHGRYYDEECCFVFNNGLLDTSIDKQFVGNILSIEGQGNFSYVSCYNKRYEDCVNHASKMNQIALFDQYTSPDCNETFKDIIKSKFDAKINRDLSYFKNVQEFTKSAIQYDSRLIMDYICNHSCSVKTFEFTGQQIIDARGEDNIFRISKFYDVALDDKIIVLKNGVLYGLTIHDQRYDDLVLDRWRVIISDQNINNEWLSSDGDKPVDESVQDEWLSLSGTDEVNLEVMDEWLAVVKVLDPTSDFDLSTDYWYELIEGDGSGDTEDNDSWFGIVNIVPSIFFELDYFDTNIRNSHTYNVPTINIEPDDIVEFLIFQHANNLIHDTIFYEDDDFNYLSEDVYNLSTNIFCRETNDTYFNFPDNGVQHFPVKYHIEHDATDPYKRRIRYEDEFYYGKEVVLANKRRFVHKRHIISEEDASGICFDFGTKFMYCNNYSNYLIFFNGRRLNKDQYRLVLPVRSTTPFFWFYIYLAVYFAEGDILDIYYIPSTMRDVYIGKIKGDGIVEVPKKNLRYPLNLDSYTFWVNGYKIPKSKIKIIDSTRLQITEDMRTTSKLTVTEMVERLPDQWIIDDFQHNESEWDRLMKSVDINTVRSLLDLHEAEQTDSLFELKDLSPETLMHELILRWYYQSEYVDTTNPFVYDYQEFDTDLTAIKEFDVANNAVLTAIDNSKTNRYEYASQTHRYQP